LPGQCQAAWKCSGRRAASRQWTSHELYLPLQKNGRHLRSRRAAPTMFAAPTLCFLREWISFRTSSWPMSASADPGQNTPRAPQPIFYFARRGAPPTTIPCNDPRFTPVNSPEKGNNTFIVLARRGRIDSFGAKRRKAGVLTSSLSKTRRLAGVQGPRGEESPWAQLISAFSVRSCNALRLLTTGTT
jgi:hypothetical protein